MITRRIGQDIIVALLLACFSFAEYANAQDVEGREVELPELGFRLAQPENWIEAQRSVEGARHFSISPKDAAGRIQVSVIADTFTNEPISFYEFLLEGLKKHPESRDVPPPNGIQGFQLAEWHARRGELDKALAEIGEGESSADHLLAASIYRRLRQADRALSQIADSQAALKSGLDPGIALEQALIRIRMGHFSIASKELQQIVDSEDAGQQRSAGESIHQLYGRRHRDGIAGCSGSGL